MSYGQVYIVVLLRNGEVEEVKPFHTNTNARKCAFEYFKKYILEEKDNPDKEYYADGMELMYGDEEVEDNYNPFDDYETCAPSYDVVEAKDLLSVSVWEQSIQ